MDETLEDSAMGVSCKDRYLHIMILYCGYID